MYFIKIKNCTALKSTVKKMKRHIPFWQKIFAKRILIKVLYIKYIKQFDNTRESNF